MLTRRSLFAGAVALSAGTLAPAAVASSSVSLRRITPPSGQPIYVAFVVDEGANVMDIAGPWETFGDVMIGDGAQMRMPFRTYTISSKRAAVSANGLHIVPDAAYSDGPTPNVVVVGAQGGREPEKLEWLREQVKSADVVMSVCTGAFVLGKAGLLDGLRATTHHEYYDAFAKAYPKVDLVRGPRFVENDKISTAGGLTSGVELALHVVARYFGEAAASKTAYYMEYNRSSTRPESA
jgi:transcriptional regulator GlxA family with amidase domain